MAKVIDGKEIANEFCAQIKERTLEIKKRGIEPRIALINTGEDPASEIYISKKEKLATSVGISSVVYKFNNYVKENEVSDLIVKLNDDAEVHAILLQSPLPKSFQFRKLINLIHPDKDVDGLTTINQGRLFSGEPGITPCTPSGVLHLLRTVHTNIAGLHAVVLGRSSIVGRPLAQLLLNSNCTVTLLHSYSKDLPTICRTADILVSAIGKPLFVRKEFVKPGATVIDVGVNKIEKNGSKKIVGDVNFDEVFEVAAAITPVPNGVGPMTVAYLMHNTLNLACCYQK
ncbi:MAG: bifunctional methylenetetrahydrofolate dehydrogenase/methenyltetrahydrofolate cyclohydrolase [Holosporaceae bacterium]|jgi:methylenetetrahydrofolate dehydrogenase (NADP+)/methenyltetrahydrofolate cyclohydrolase|nr:bifunctional methylenetetrahydrofolate dehydrogenase/methenyltetrahydrofolate cyclohydrolase [Holosporaceae bacterium]